MGFVEAIKTCFRKYIVFSGRAARAEFWWFVLGVFVVSALASLLDGALFGTVEVETTENSNSVSARNGPLASLWGLATFLPMLAAGWRRMHDTGRPGWYLLLPVILQVSMVVLVLLGVAGFSALEQSANNPETLRVPAAATGLAGTFAFMLAQLVVAVLLIWWLSRRGDPGPNTFGPPPLSTITDGTQL